MRSLVWDRCHAGGDGSAPPFGCFRVRAVPHCSWRTHSLSGPPTRRPPGQQLVEPPLPLPGPPLPLPRPPLPRPPASPSPSPSPTPHQTHACSEQLLRKHEELQAAEAAAAASEAARGASDAATSALRGELAAAGETARSAARAARHLGKRATQLQTALVEQVAANHALTRRLLDAGSALDAANADAEAA
eukprot:25248-Chlamydomonas_euryale.AAC.1